MKKQIKILLLILVLVALFFAWVLVIRSGSCIGCDSAARCTSVGGLCTTEESCANLEGGTYVSGRANTCNKGEICCIPLP